MTPESLHAMSWALFEAWMLAGAPSKEIWPLYALGFLGNDETARRITPLLRAWPGENASSRAVAGLCVLSLIGSDLALMLLDGIAEKVRFASIQQAAKKQITAIAEKRGMTREQLADRLVPDLGLDAKGELTLDFGPRSFRVILDEHLEPVVLDREHKRLAALPKPGNGDDEAKAKAEIARFKAFKKDLKTIAKSRIDRLERAMIARQTWTKEELGTIFLGKPLHLQIGRRVVWGAYAAGGTRVGTFRIDEAGALADATDEVLELSADVQRVGLVHPADLTSDEIATWARIFADYEIIQPFPQLAREVFRVATADDEKITFSPPRVFRAPKLVFGLERLGWRRGGAEDGGAFSEHTKAFSGTPFTARVTYDGAVGMGYVEADEELSVGELTIETSEGARRVADVDPIVVSEVLRDLSVVEAS